MRANVNITRKQRHTLTLENFKGVDLSSSPLRVSTQRATYMRNLWSENGANHKRPGWREIFKLDGKINGIFPFEERSGGVGKDVLLVHAEKRLYRVEHTADGWMHRQLRDGLTDTSSQCFYRDGRAYIIGCGAYLVYGEFDKKYALKDVSEIAYVPTTTISIGENDTIDMHSATLEDINLLTPWRKNRLDASIFENSSHRYQLDGMVDGDEKITVNGWFFREEELIQSGEIVRYEGEIVFKVKMVAPEASANKNLEWIQCNVTSTRVINGKEFSQGELELDAFKTKFDPSFNVDVYGTVRTTLSWSSLEVTFRSNHRGLGKIEKNTVGALFGVDGASNRLFLSGNPDEKGLDRWSEADDFTYFPDGNAMFVGGGESAVTGYARLSDGTLGIFKEEVPGYQTIYYRTGAKTTMVDADGETVPQEYFPVEAGMAGEGLVSPSALANLGGDPLILTPSGVFGIELSQNVASGERYTRERSRAIREELRKKELAGAVGFAWRGKYYLSLGDADGTCYVADSRYKASFEGSADVGYEWWVWDHVPATAFAEIEGMLAFGTAEGRVCVFEAESYADRTYILAESGDLLGNADKNYVTYGNIAVREGDILLIGEKRYRVTGLDTTENQRFSLTDEEGNAVDFEDGFLTGVIEHSTPVVAEWASAVMDLGTSMARKTLLSCGVTIEPGVRGPVQISLKTRDGAQGLLAQNGHDFDFGALDLGDLSFTGSFAASTTRRMNLRNFNFIQLRMRSDTPTDMAVSGVTLEYKINQMNRGYY